MKIDEVCGLRLPCNVGKSHQLSLLHFWYLAMLCNPVCKIQECILTTAIFEIRLKNYTEIFSVCLEMKKTHQIQQIAAFILQNEKVPNLNNL